MNHKDMPRKEILAYADQVIKQFEARGLKVWVNFKFTCEHCGERCGLVDKNLLWEKGECCKCGKETEIKKAGFALSIDYPKK